MLGTRSRGPLSYVPSDMELHQKSLFIEDLSRMSLEHEGHLYHQSGNATSKIPHKTPKSQGRHPVHRSAPGGESHLCSNLGCPPYIGTWTSGGTVNISSRTLTLQSDMNVDHCFSSVTVVTYKEMLRPSDVVELHQKSINKYTLVHL